MEPQAPDHRPAPRIRLQRILLALLLAAAAVAVVAPAAVAQVSAFSVAGGIGLPLSGMGPREDVAYGDLYKAGISLAVQYRRLFQPHLSLVGELGFSKQPINAETFAMLLNAGDLVVKGGDLSRQRLSFGVAWESNTIDGPNLVLKVLPGMYRTAPSSVTVTSPTEGLLQVNQLSTISDFGLNFGLSMEKTIKPRIAIVAGADVDWIFGSDLFDPNRTTTLMNVTVKGGIAYWF